MSLSKAKPAPKQLLIQSFAEQLEVTRVISVCLEHFSDVLTFKGRPKLVRLEKLVPQLSGGCPKLIALLTVTLAAQTRRVVGGKRRPAPLAAAAARSAGHALLRSAG
ncbi:hypothetical protein [Amycolatopsis sp. NPDC051102]|uniref:hypothetical protein n=1 Tax=Amycolatopsis sp. NPDC051102 TaxID=3155163 RepID=UPI0034348413